MELKIIDGQPFIVSGHGKKAAIQTPEEATQAAHDQINAANQIIIGLRRAAQVVQERIETSVLNGDDARSHRAELDAIRQEIADHERDMLEAFSTVGEIAELIDQSVAAAIRQTDEISLAESLARFDISHITGA